MTTTLTPPTPPSPAGADRPTRPADLAPSRMHPGDVLRSGSIGLRTRRLRAGLSALGIAIGIAAMVSVLGISESSKQNLLSVLDQLGTNLLQVKASTGIGAGGNGQLPPESPSMLGRIGPVQEVSAVTSMNAKVYRTDYVPAEQTGGLTAKATDPRLLSALGGTMHSGRFLDDVSVRYPTVVLGSVAAERLGIDQPGARIQIGGEWFDVIGVMDSLTLGQDIDRSVLVGNQIAQSMFDNPTSPETVYLRADPDQVTNVEDVIPATANPDNPDQVQVSRPSDAIEAKAAASNAFTALFLGLGAVALLVGGVGIANVMVISVLERRSEIGLRRALGATKRHVAVQFLSEALLLSFLGGLGGVTLGALVTAGYDLTRGWAIVVPIVGLLGGLAAALLIGAVAGLYPALRAARLAPAEALRTV
jgi:putative ABC transport system permease protein